MAADNNQEGPDAVADALRALADAIRQELGGFRRELAAVNKTVGELTTSVNRFLVVAERQLSASQDAQRRAQRALAQGGHDSQTSNDARREEVRRKLQGARR